jgi:hypothetical protein
MLRVWERAEDKEAPRVPDDNANAAERKGVHFHVGLGERIVLRYVTDSQDVFLPKFGPDNWMVDA